MANSASNSLPAFGFLTAVEDDSHGFFGGYLLLSELGRPLEFHCSTPILPNPAQKILYGSTLRSYVLGELIGQTLVKQAKLPIQAILTDLQEMLSLSLFWQGDLAHLTPTQPAASASGSPPPLTTDAPPTSDAPPTLNIQTYRLTGSSTCQWLPAELQQKLTTLASYVDLEEPFQRIREAIQEAQRVTEHPTAEADDASAAA